MAVATTQQLVSALYVAVFNRAPDKAGLDSWVAQINGGRTFAQVASGFTTHEVFTQGIGTLGNAEFVAALYTNVLGSAGDAAGVAGWVALLNGGASKASVAASFVQAALTVDIPALLAAGSLSAADAAAATIRQNTLTNKADAGTYFADTLGARSNLNANTVTSSKAGLEADPIYNASKAAIASVTNTPASLQAAKDAIAVAAGSSNPAQALLGNTYTLTTGNDNLTGGPSSDTFNADQTTFNATDIINGGAGKDTLNLVDSGTAAWTAPAAQVSNVEVINVRNVNGTAATTGAKEVATATFGAVTAGDTVILDGKTFAPVANATAAEAAAFFASQTYTDYVVTSTNGTQVVLTAKTSGDKTNLVITGTSAGQTIAIVNGTADTAATSQLDTINVGNFVGATNFNATQSSGAVTFAGDLSATQQVGVVGNNAAVNATFGAAVTSTTLNVSGGNKGGLVTLNGNGLAAVTINSTGAANVVGGVSLAGSALTALTIAAETNLTTGAITGFAAGSTATNTLNVSGIASTVNVGTLSNVGTVNASGLTLGGVTANLGTNTTIKFTGGAGTDTITTGGTVAAVVLATGASVDAGAGTADRLVIGNSGDITNVSGAFYKGFEQVQVRGGVSTDISFLAANNKIDTVVIGTADGATPVAHAAASVTGLNAAQAAAVQITSANSGSALTIGITGATNGGQIDTVKAALSTTAAGVAQAIDLTGITLTGIEKLALTGNGTVAATTGQITLTTSAATSLDNITVSTVGNSSITVSSGHTATNLVVDASASSGITFINASAYATATGATLTGGSGNDAIYGSAGADTLVGGAGNDLLVGGAAAGGANLVGSVVSATATAPAKPGTIAATVQLNADILTGGAGNDAFVIGHSSVANASTITDLNLGTAVVAGGVDSLWFNATAAAAATVVSLTAVQQTAVSQAVDLAAAVNAVLAIASTAKNVAQFTYGTDTYIVANSNGGATYAAADHSLVKVTGVVGTLDASDINFVAAI